MHEFYSEEKLDVSVDHRRTKKKSNSARWLGSKMQIKTLENPISIYIFTLSNIAHDYEFHEQWLARSSDEYQFCVELSIIQWQYNKNEEEQRRKKFNKIKICPLSFFFILPSLHSLYFFLYF